MIEPTQEQLKKWDEWVATRPDNVRAVAERFNPWLEYQFKSTKRLCRLHSISEHQDGSVTLKVVAQQMFVDHLVFGVQPDDIEPRDENAVDIRVLAGLSP